MTSPTPPLPPSVINQQMPPDVAALSQMNGPMTAPPAQFNEASFLMDRLTQIASLLKDVADVLVTTKPAMMPILEQMIQAGSALSDEVQKMVPAQPAPAAGQTQAQMPQPPGGAGAVGMA